MQQSYFAKKNVIEKISRLLVKKYSDLGLTFLNQILISTQQPAFKFNNKRIKSFNLGTFWSHSVWHCELVERTDNQNLFAFGLIFDNIFSKLKVEHLP